MSYTSIAETLQEAREYMSLYRSNETQIYGDVWKAQQFRSGFAQLHGKLAVEMNELAMMIPQINKAINLGTLEVISRLKREGINSTESVKRVKGELADLYEDSENVEQFIKAARNIIEAIKAQSDSLSSLIKLMESDLFKPKTVAK